MHDRALRDGQWLGPAGAKATMGHGLAGRDGGGR